MVRPKLELSLPSPNKKTIYMIVSITYFPQDSDFSYPLSPYKMRDLSQKLDGNAVKFCLFAQAYASSGHWIFRFYPEEVMEALQMSWYMLRKAMTTLENVFGVKFGPMRDWQMEVPKGQLSPAPTPSTGKWAQRGAATESSRPAAAVAPSAN